MFAMASKTSGRNPKIFKNQKMRMGFPQQDKPMKQTIVIFLALCGLCLCTMAQSQTTPGIIRETRGSHRYCGFIKQDGKVVVRPIYLNAHEFSEGLAAVQDTNNRWGFINPAGKRVFVLPASMKQVGDFHEGLCWFRDSESKKVGYIDRTGKVAINPQWDYARDFNDGLAAVGYGWNMGERMYRPDRMIGYIDHTGNVVIPVNVTDRHGDNYNWADFSCGRAILQDGDSVLIIDTKGNQLFKRKYRRAGGFSEGFCAVGTAANAPCNAGDGDPELPDCNYHWSVIDTAGNIVLDNYANRFHEGVSCLHLSGDDYIYIDATGKQITERHFKYARSFHEGLAFVTEMDDSQGFIDHTGKMVLRLTYGKATYSCDGFKNGIVTIWERTETNDRKTTYYDEEVRNREGRIIWMDSYTVFFP